MTVRELIFFLKKMDQNAIVVCRRYSDLMEMEKPESKEVILYNGQYKDNWYTFQFPDATKVKVCFFEGN